MSIKIDTNETTSIKNLESPYELYKSYIIEKQHYTLSHIVNWIDLFKYVTQKFELSYNNKNRGDIIV